MAAMKGQLVVSAERAPIEFEGTVDRTPDKELHLRAVFPRQEPSDASHIFELLPGPTHSVRLEDSRQRTWTATEHLFTDASPSDESIEGHFLLRNLDWNGDATSAEPTKRFRANLTQFDLALSRAKMVRRGSESRMVRFMTFETKLGKFTIQQKWNHFAVAERMRQRRTVESPCYLSAVTFEEVSLARAFALVQDISTLLSLCAGNFVGALDVRLFGEDRRVKAARLTSPVTRPFTSLNLIPGGWTGIYAKNTTQLMSSAMNWLPVWNERLRASDAEQPMTWAIKSILDARAETTYLQTRTLAALTALEILISRYSEAEGIAHSIPRSRFDRLARELRKVIRESEPNLSGSLEAKLPELRRSPIKKSIEVLYDEIGLTQDLHRLSTYFTIRDSIVHTGSFADDLSMSPFEQFGFILETVDRLILKMLGYSGAYRSMSDIHSQATL